MNKQGKDKERTQEGQGATNVAKDKETRKGMTDNEEMGKGHRKDRGLTNVAKDNATKKGKKQDDSQGTNGEIVHE